MLLTIFTKKDLISNLVVNDMKGRYWGSFFGFWGSIVNPLLLLLIYCFVFSGILKIKFSFSGETGNFAIHLFCGMLPWMGFSEAVQRSSTVLMDHGTLIKRVRFPKEVLPFYVTISAFVHMLLGFSVFLIVLLFLKIGIGIEVLFLLLVFPLQILFAFGFSLVVSSLHIFFRDIGIFIGTILQIWFFCTPIFYPENLIPERFQPLMKVNPVFHLVRIYREAILNASIPSLRSFIYFAVASLAAFFLGAFVFTRIKDRIVDYI
jgi:ABC-type polysaccharide/polyol phosphate export permease